MLRSASVPPDIAEVSRHRNLNRNTTDSHSCLDKGVRVCCPKDSAHAIKEPRLGTEHNAVGESEHDDRVGFVSLPVSETERIADKVDDREGFVSLPLSEMEAETTSSELDAPSEQRKTTLSAASCWPHCSDGGS